MDVDLQLENILQQLLLKNPERIEVIKNKIADKSYTFKEQLLKVLQAELERSFFNHDHFKNTYLDKYFFDFQVSTDISDILGEVFKKQDFSEKLALNNGQITQGTNEEEIAESLRTQGFMVFPQRLSSSTLQAIKDGLKGKKYTTKDLSTSYIINDEEALSKVRDNTCWIFDQQDVLNIPMVQQLIMDPVLLNGVQNYLGCPPVHVQVNNWWSHNNSLDDELALNRSAQQYHQDKEFIKFVKVFIYLSDVEEENGPHQYIAGSHRDYLDHTSDDYQVSHRLTDEYLRSQYEDQRFQSFTGKKGTVIIEDTSGFHKGKPVIKGHRHILQLEFASSLYFNPVPCFSGENLQSEFKEFLQENARFSLNYDHQSYQSHLKQRTAAHRKQYCKYLIKKILGKNP